MVVVAYSLPGRYEEPSCFESSPLIVINEQSRNVVAGPVEQRLICGRSVVDEASITWSGVYISPVAHQKWRASRHWEWLRCKTGHTIIKRDGSIVVDLQKENARIQMDNSNHHYKHQLPLYQKYIGLYD